MSDVNSDAPMLAKPRLRFVKLKIAAVYLLVPVVVLVETIVCYYEHFIEFFRDMPAPWCRVRPVLRTVKDVVAEIRDPGVTMCNLLRTDWDNPNDM